MELRNQLCTRAAAALPRKEVQCLLYMGMGGHQIRFGRFKVEKNLFSLSSFELRTVQPAAL